MFFFIEFFIRGHLSFGCWRWLKSPGAPLSMVLLPSVPVAVIVLGVGGILLSCGFCGFGFLAIPRLTATPYRTFQDLTWDQHIPINNKPFLFRCKSLNRNLKRHLLCRDFYAKCSFTVKMLDCRKQLYKIRITVHLIARRSWPKMLFPSLLIISIQFTTRFSEFNKFFVKLQ